METQPPTLAERLRALATRITELLGELARLKRRHTMEKPATPD